MWFDVFPLIPTKTNTGDYLKIKHQLLRTLKIVI